MNNEVITFSSNESTDHNVVDAVNTDKDITFKESYIVVGELLKGRNIYANYDLRIMGDIEADSITVLGNLYVSGDIRARKLSCSKKVICEGDIDSDEIIIDDSVFSNNIACSSITASEIIVRESVDAKEKVDVEGNVLAGDGILGYGKLSAENIIATNYFDFSGDVTGKVFDLSEDDESDEDNEVDDVGEEDIPFDEIVDVFAYEVRNQVLAWHKEEEDEFLKRIDDLSNRIPDYTMVSNLASKVIEYTYNPQIKDLYDFLILFWARKTFPEEVKLYETIKLATDTMFNDAVVKIDTLSFNPKTVDDVVTSLYIVISYKESLPISYEYLLDTIFAKIGPRYQTVLQLLNK